MGFFTDELNKIKQKIATAPVPKLGQTTPFIPTYYDIPKKVSPMVFNVGEGLTPDENQIAQETVRKVDPYAKIKPYSFTESLGLFRQRLENQVAKKQGKPEPNLYAPSDQESTEILSTIVNPVFGATSGLVKGFTQKATPELLEFLAKTKSPQVIESEIVKLGIKPEVAKIYAPRLAATNTIDEVKNVLMNETSIVPRKAPGQNTPPISNLPGIKQEVSKLPVATETPAQALARSEAYATSKHLTPEQQAAQDFKKRWADTYGNRPATIESPTQLQQRKVQLSEEGIPMARKSVPFMPKAKSEVPTSDLQFQPPVPQAQPLDTTTGEGRSLEIAGQKELPTVSPQNIPPKDVSLVDTISKEPTPVKNKVNIVDYIRTPDRVLKKIGLEKEGEILRAQHDKYLKELPKNIDKITEWSKRASKTGNEDIFRYLDGEAIDLKPQDKQVATEIKTWLKQWADRLGLPEDNRLQHYITHIFDQELIKKEFPEELAKLIDNKLPGEVYDPFLQKRLGALGYKKDTWAALDAYVKRATRKVNLDPALEKIKDASAMLEKSQYDFVKSYIANINMRPGKIDTLIDNVIKQLIGYKLGQRPLLSVTKFLRQMTYRAMLGLNPASALKNLSQGVNTYSKLGEKYTIIGYAKLFSKGSKTELEAEGVLNGGFIEDRALSATKKAIEKFDKGLFIFFETAEHINRGAAYFGAKAQGIAKGMPEAEAINYAKKIVRDTQFTFGKIDTPLALSSDLGKTLGQFQSYTTKQTEFLTEMMKRAVKGDEKAKNFIGLLRYAVAGTIFVYTIGQAFNMKITDLVPSIRFGTPPSLKLPIESTKAVLNTPDKYGKERDLGQKLQDVGNAALGLIPGSTQGKKTFQGYQAIKEGASKDSSGRAQYDVGGTPLKDAQALIFGKYAGQGAQDYYDNDMTYAEATLARLKGLGKEKGKEELAKIVKDNPALWEGIQKVIKKQALGITKDDEKLLNLGVATKARAKEVANQINKLKTPEEKKALLAEYVKKKIITLDVMKQLSEFLTK